MNIWIALELNSSLDYAQKFWKIKCNSHVMPIILLLLQVETIDDYDEYCHYVAGLVGLGLSKLFHASKLEDLASDELSNSMGLFLQVIVVLIWYMLQLVCFIPSQLFVSHKSQKTNIIRDYLEDINEIPKSRMFWPREIWSKYVNKLEVCPFPIFYFQIIVVSMSLSVILILSWCNAVYYNCQCGYVIPKYKRFLYPYLCLSLIAYLLLYSENIYLRTWKRRKTQSKQCNAWMTWSLML